MHPACNFGLSGQFAVHTMHGAVGWAEGEALRRLEVFVIYMPCIKFSPVITISIYCIESLPQIQRGAAYKFAPIRRHLYAFPTMLSTIHLELATLRRSELARLGFSITLHIHTVSFCKTTFQENTTRAL